MGKAKKIAVLLLITIISIVGVVGYLAFSFSQSTAYISDTRLEDNIQSDNDLLNPTFSGFVNLEQDIYIFNSGQLDIEQLSIDIQVFFRGNIDTTEVEVGMGSNLLGTLPAGENVSKTVTVELSNFIARLAVEDGNLRIVLDIKLQLQYVSYTIEIPTQETSEPWNAPFGV